MLIICWAVFWLKVWLELSFGMISLGKRPEPDIFNNHGVPPLCGQLIAWMTRYKADERPIIDEVLKHP